MKPALARKILAHYGWEIIGTKAPEQIAVILEAPHTSMWDFIIGWLYYEAVGGHLKIMAKKELFFWPLNRVLRWMGAFPIDRSHPARSVISTIHAMESVGEGEDFHMVLCPEGTRKPVAHWKTGYHTIASRAGCAVYLSTIDWGRKQVGIFQRYELLGNSREDVERIQQIYGSKGFTGKHPERYICR